MPWTPRFLNYAGLLPLLQNARAVIERDIADALAWSYGSSAPGESFKRIQFTQRHSQVFPLLVIQPASSEPQIIAGGIGQSHTFDVEIFLVRAASSGNLSDEIDLLPQDLIRYLDATVMVFLSASPVDWRVNMTGDQGRVEVGFANVIFGQLQQSQERDGKYLHSVAFELTVSLLESE